MLSVLGDLVRRGGPDPVGEELGERPPYVSDHLTSRLGGVAGCRAAAPGRGDLEQQPGYVPLYLAKLPGLVQRLPEAADLVRQTELVRLCTGPDPPPRDALEVARLHAPSARDAVLELVVDEAELPFEHPQLVRRRPAAGVEQPGPRAALEGDGVDAELPVEVFRDGTDGDDTYGAGDGVAPDDHVVRRRRDVVATGGRDVAHEDDHGFPGADALDLAPDQIRRQGVAAAGLHVEEHRRHAPVSLRQPQRRDDGLAPRLLSADERQGERELAAPSPHYGPREAHQPDPAPQAPPIRHAQGSPRHPPLRERGRSSLPSQPLRQLVFVADPVEQPPGMRLGGAVRGAVDPGTRLLPRDLPPLSDGADELLVAAIQEPLGLLPRLLGEVVPDERVT